MLSHYPSFMVYSTRGSIGYQVGLPHTPSTHPLLTSHHRSCYALHLRDPLGITCKIAMRIQAPIKAMMILPIRPLAPSPSRPANHPPMKAPMIPTTMSPTSP